MIAHAPKPKPCVLCLTRPVIGPRPDSWNSRILCAECKAREDAALVKMCGVAMTQIEKGIE